MFDHVLTFEGEAKKVIIKVVELNLYMIPHNGSGFNSYVALNILPQRRSVINSITNAAGVNSPKIFIGCVVEKQIPQFVHLRCGRVHINSNLKK